MHRSPYKDDDFRQSVDNGDVKVDTWHWQEYPPYDGTSLAKIQSDIANADYISLCVGICDYVNYPTDVKDARMEILGNTDEASDHIRALLSEGVISDEVFCDYIKLLNMHSDKSIILLNYVLDMLEGNRTYAGGVDMIVPFCSQIEAAEKLIAPFAEITKGAVSFSKKQAALLLKDKYINVVSVK